MKTFKIQQKQLAEYITGMDTRIGYPNEHLAGNSDSETTSPLYATAVGLVLNSLEQKNAKFQEQVRFTDTETKNKDLTPTSEKFKSENSEDEYEEDEMPQSSARAAKKSIFDKWAEKFKDFLDNAE